MLLFRFRFESTPWESLALEALGVAWDAGRLGRDPTHLCSTHVYIYSIYIFLLHVCVCVCFLCVCTYIYMYITCQGLDGSGHNGLGLKGLASGGFWGWFRVEDFVGRFGMYNSNSG